MTAASETLSVTVVYTKWSTRHSDRDRYHRAKPQKTIFSILVADDGRTFHHVGYEQNPTGLAFLAAGRGARFTVTGVPGFIAKPGVRYLRIEDFERIA